MAKTIPIQRGDYYFVPPITGYTEEMLAVPRVSNILDEVDKIQITNWKVRQAALYAFANPGASMGDAMGAPNRAAKQAAVRGSTIHSWIEAHENGVQLDIEDLPEDSRPFAAAFEKYADTFDPHLVAIESIVANVTHRYGGKLDAIQVDRSERKLLVDYKTSKAIYPEHRWQLSAYRHAEWILKREGVETIAYPFPKLDGQMIVCLKPDGNFVVEEMPDDFETFLAYKHVWHSRHNEPCPSSCFCKHLEAIARDVQLDRMGQEVAADVVGG